MEYCGFWNANNGANVLGHGIVEPGKDALVDHDPLVITAVCAGWRGREVRTETKFANESIEETAPLDVVGLNNVEFDRDVGFDVDGF